MDDQDLIISDQLEGAPNQALFTGRILAKSIGEDDETWKFAGIASDETEDVDGDQLLRKSIDLSYAKERGFVNWDHSRAPEDQLGFLTTANVIAGKDMQDLQKSFGVKIGKSATVYVEGQLYKHMPRAQYVQKMLKSTPDPSKGPGLSLDGVVARNTNSGEPVRAFVRGVAITPVPVQTKTLCKLIKSLQDYSVGQSGSRASGTKEALVKGLTADEAALFVLKRNPTWTFEFAEKLVKYTIQQKKGA